MSKSNDLAVAAVFAALLGSCGVAPVSNTPITVTLGTATPGGGFPVYGAAFAEAVREADPTIAIDARNTRGSAENIPLLEASQLDLALVQGEAAYEALAGINRSGPAKLKVVWAMYSTPGMFAVRADSPYRSISDLKGKPVAWGAKGSGFVLQAGYVLDALGLDRDRDFQPVYLERARDGPAMLRDGRVAALWGGGIGWPGFVEATKAPGGARFIAPNRGEIDRILAKHKFLKLATVPAGSYPSQVLDIPSVGSWSFVFARPDLPDETAYRVARALHRGEARLGAKLAQARESTAHNTYGMVAGRDLLHPGVRRYLREAGVGRD